MGWLKDFMVRTKDSAFVHILDPGGIFREDGFLGWDLFGLDTTSEDAIAAAEAQDKQMKIDAAAKFNASVDNVKSTAKAIIIGAIVLFVLIYSVKKGWITYK